jgi:chromosome segregation ATPase
MKRLIWMMLQQNSGINGWVVAIIGALTTLAGGAVTYVASRKKNDSEGEKALAEAAAVTRRSEIEVSDAAVKIAQSAWSRLEEVMTALTNAERRVDELQEDLYKVREELHDERHKARNLQQQMLLIQKEAEQIAKEADENKQRYQLTVKMLEKENERIRNENKKLKGNDGSA